jgi:hypothetical protein
VSHKLQPIIKADSEPAVSWVPYPALDQSTFVNGTCTADFNLDGIIDIAYSSDNNGLKLMLNDGGLNWTATTPPSSTGIYISLTSGDLNNDGTPDIIAGKNGGISAWTKNRTTGSWQPASNGLPGTRQFRSVEVGDVDKDGNLDIVAGSAAGGPNKGVVVYKGNGRGSWTLSDAGLPLFGTYSSVALGDLNRDGNLDIAAAGNIGVDAWVGDGKGNWSLRDSGLPASGSYSSVEFGDFNLDGRLDIVAASEQGAGIRMWSGDGTGIWTFRLGLPTTGSYSGVEVGDVNLDGSPDVVASSTSNNQTVWTGNCGFDWSLQNQGLSSDANLNGVFVADFDRDGRLDIGGSSVSGGVRIWSGRVERTVNAWTEIDAPDVGFLVRDIVASDINIDGKVDLCYATSTGGVRLFEGNGSGGWAVHPSPSHAGTVTALEVCDFNRDGKPDLVAATSAGVLAWSGNGAGAWTSRISGLPSAGAWSSVAVGDFNGDGKPDMIVGSSQGAGLRAYSGDGTGIWAFKLGLPLTGTFHDIAAADVNRDGALDAVVASATGPRCYLGNRAFNWTQASAGLPVGTAFNCIDAADANRDGALDVLAASADSNGLTLWLGDGAGGWTYGSQPGEPSSGGFAVGDIDLDGIKDVVCAFNGSSTGLACSVQRQGGWIDLSTGLPTNGEYAAVSMSDVNADGRLDILASNGTSPGARAWVGECVPPPAPWFNVSVVLGWNLISVPILADGLSLPIALSDMADGGGGLVQWSRVMWYNRSDASDPWKQYNTEWAPSLNDMTVVNPAMGLWVLVTSAGDGNICLGGEGYVQRANTQVDLRAGWNLVGYPSATSGQTVADLKAQCPSVDSVEVFEPSSAYRTSVPGDGYEMKPGEGYWVHAISDTVWLVP